jgi:predicted Zn finger-like uncharacterized protein
MNVTCPSCATIYRVDPAKVPDAGVRARCKVCAAIFPVTKAAPAASVAVPDTDATVKRPAIPPMAAIADPDATVKRPAVVPKPLAADAGAALRRPAFSMEPDRPREAEVDADTTAPRSQVGLDTTAPRPAPAAEADLERGRVDTGVETTAKRTAMPPDLDETARRPQVEPAAGAGLPPRPPMPPLPARPTSGPPPAVPGAGRPTAPRQFPPPAAAPPRGPAMPPPAVRAAAAPVGPPPLVPPLPPKAPPPPAPAAGAAPAAPARPAAGRPVNPFLSQDPAQKARRLARALISDLAVYYPDRRKEGLAQGTLKQLFQEEIQKSWEEFTEQVGKEMAESTTYFNDALNEILAGGQRVF